MATKREKEKLENLLDWKREGGRLPEQTKLFNQEVSETLTLREHSKKNWALEVFKIDDDGRIHRSEIFLRHETLVSLGLLIMDAIDFVDKR